jgi:hypothetical protein
LPSLWTVAAIWKGNVGTVGHIFDPLAKDAKCARAVAVRTWIRFAAATRDATNIATGACGDDSNGSLDTTTAVRNGMDETNEKRRKDRV